MSEVTNKPTDAEKKDRPGKPDGKKKTAESSPASATAGPPAFDPAQFTADQRAQIEKLSLNLARAALIGWTMGVE